MKKMKKTESKSNLSLFIVAVQALFAILVLVRGCEANSDCKQVRCPAGETPDASATVFGFGLDYQCTCGKDM